jgi:hypothetical protein
LTSQLEKKLIYKKKTAGYWLLARPMQKGYALKTVYQQQQQQQQHSVYYEDLWKGLCAQN